jgi:hypothetical protein
MVSKEISGRDNGSTQRKIKPGAIAKTIKRELGEDVSYSTVLRAKEFAIKSINVN